MTVLKWIPLHTTVQVEEVKQRSFEVPCLIFKHSTRCNISSIAQYRLETDWDLHPETLEAYYLDLLSHRNVSSYIEDTFQVYHESPQVLLIQNGECILDVSHLDISIEEIKEGLQFASKN